MADWTAMLRAEQRDLRIGGKIVFLGGSELALNGDMIAGLTIEEGAGGALLPGAVLSASCTLELVNDSGQWLSGGAHLGNREIIGATLMPMLGAAQNGETIWKSLGVYQVESALYLEGEGVLRVAAADSASFELSGSFADGLVYPATLENIWNHAVGQSRYIFSGSVPNGSAVVDSMPDWKNASLRTVLGWIAAAAGCFVRIDREGVLELCPVLQGEYHGVGPAAYFSLEKDSARFGPVDALELTPAGRDAQKKIYYGPALSCVHPVAMSGNPLFMDGAVHLDALAQGMLDSILGYASAALRIQWRGDPEVRIGDRILAADLNNNTVTGVVSRQTLRFDGGFSAVTVCAIPENAESGVRRAITPEGGLNASALVGSINGGLISAGSITTDKLAAGSVTAEKLEASIIDAVSIEAVAAKIESLTASDIKTDRLAAALAAFTVITAGSASFDRATVGHLVSNALNLQFGVGDQVFINNLAVAYAQMVGAAIGNLCIKASDGNYYAIDVDENGCVKATRTAVSQGEISAGQTDAGRVILGTSVTAESLNTSNLLSTYALVNKIDAARIDVDQLFARQAFVDKLSTSEIVAGQSLTIIAGKASQALENSQTGVAGVDVEYYLSASTQYLSGGSWQTTAPAWTAGKYMWSRTKTTLKDGTSSYSNPTCIAGAKGDAGADGAPGTNGTDGADGKDGQNGTDGVGVSAIAEQYYLSTSKDSPTGGSWLSAAPEWSPGSYLFTRSMIVYSDSTVSYTSPIADTTWELADEAAKLAGSAQDTADQAKNAADSAVTRPEFERVVRIDAAGLHVGDNLSGSEVRIDSGNVRVMVGGESYSSFGANYLQLGDDVRIRRPKGGGVAFSPIRR